MNGDCRQILELWEDLICAARNSACHYMMLACSGWQEHAASNMASRTLLAAAADRVQLSLHVRMCRFTRTLTSCGALQALACPMIMQMYVYHQLLSSQGMASGRVLPHTHMYMGLQGVVRQRHAIPAQRGRELSQDVPGA